MAHLLTIQSLGLITIAMAYYKGQPTTTAFSTNQLWPSGQKLQVNLQLNHRLHSASLKIIGQGPPKLSTVAGENKQEGV